MSTSLLWKCLLHHRHRQVPVTQLEAKPFWRTLVLGVPAFPLHTVIQDMENVHLCISGRGNKSPTQAKEDESTKEGEAGEDELAVGTSKIPAAKPGLRAKKKKEKRAGGNCPYLSPVPVAFALPLIYPEVGDWVTLLHVSPLSLKAFSLPSGYSAPPFPGVTSRPVVPAKRAELVEMAKAVHREQFDDQVNNLFQWEKDSTLKAIQTGEPRWPSRGL